MKEIKWLAIDNLYANFKAKLQEFKMQSKG